MMNETRATATERAEWNLVVATQIERDHAAAIEEDRIRTAERGCALGHFGWAANLTRQERNEIESRCH